MNTYIVSATRIPTNYNDPRSYVVEAACEDDARQLVKHSLRDFADLIGYVYAVKPYVPPPAGRIVGVTS